MSGTVAVQLPSVAVRLRRDLKRGAEAVERASGSRTVDRKPGGGATPTMGLTGTWTIIIHK